MATASGTRNTRNAVITVSKIANFEAFQRLRVAAEDHGTKTTAKRPRTTTILPDRQSKRQNDKRIEELEVEIGVLENILKKKKAELYDRTQ